MHRLWSALRAAAPIAALGCWAVPTLVAAAQPPEWTQPVQPFRIAPGLYYVGTKGLAAYLITSKQGAILLEGTVAENAPLIERNIQTVGVPLKQVKLILSDHAHFDHVGAIAQIKRDTGAAFDASAEDAPALERGLPRGDTDYGVIGFAPVKVDRTIRDGESVAVGSAVLTAHLTPGHTPGCTSWSMTVRDGDRRLRVLFLGSITVAGNVLVGNRAYPAIAADFEKTFARLGAMKADIVLTSHPEMADVMEREARLQVGDKNAFIDPTTLPTLVSKSKAAFENTFAKAKYANLRVEDSPG
jgi:metallo-beta-lactamase class B